MKVEIAASTNIGRRNNNQDAYQTLVDQSWACLVVADGLGGHEMGDVIATQFCEECINLARPFSENIFKDPKKFLKQHYHATVENVQKYFSHNFPGVDAHTTCAIAWINDDMILTLHVGDSRVYLFDGTNISWRTRDHSLVQNLVDDGYISEYQMKHHLLQNQILKTVNTSMIYEPETHQHKALQPHELLLLCTDGFWTVAPLEWFNTLSKTPTLQTSLEEIIQNAVTAGGEFCDNITGIAVRLRS